MRASLRPSDLNPGPRLVIALPPNQALTDLVAAAPDTQFLALGIPGAQPAPNLTTIAGQTDRTDMQGYLAGYTAAALSEGWRVGVIGDTSTPQGKGAVQGFLNGVVYFCGLCRPPYPPFFQYPVSAEVSSGASAEELKSAADELIAQGVLTAYVAPGVGSDELFTYLADQGVNIIAGVDPPAGVKEHWVATIKTDTSAAVKSLLPKLLAGQGGATLEAPLVMDNRNPDLFSPGKQHLVEGFMADLESGYVDTGVDPTTGEPR